MKTATLIMPLEATTDINPRKSSGVTAGAIAGATEGVTAVAISGATAGVTAAAAEQQRLQFLNARILD